MGSSPQRTETRVQVEIFCVKKLALRIAGRNKILKDEARPPGGFWRGISAEIKACVAAGVSVILLEQLNFLPDEIGRVSLQVLVASRAGDS